MSDDSRVRFPADTDVFPVDTSSLRELDGHFFLAKLSKAGFALEVPYGLELDHAIDGNGLLQCTDRFVTLAHFATDRRPEMFVKVAGSRLPRELSPADWLALELTQSGREIIKHRVAYTKCGWDLDALAIASTDTSRIISRNGTLKDGGVVYWIEAGVREELYPSVSSILFRAMNSLTLLSPSHATAAEVLVPYQLDHSLPIQFQYPASWELTRASISDSEFSLLLHNRVGDVSMGNIGVFGHVGPISSGAAANIQRFANHLEQLQIIVPELQFQVVDPQSAGRSTLIANASADSKVQRQFQVGALLFEYPGGCCLLGSVSPDSSDTPEWWAINKRAFEIVRDSLLDSVN